jgi:hypothetical protein
MQCALALLLLATPTVEVPKEHWVPNRSGSQCCWCSLELLANFHGIDAVKGVTRTHKHASGYGEIEGYLNRLNVKHRSQRPGVYDDAILHEAVKFGALIGIPGHALVAVDYDGSRIAVIDNSDLGRGVHWIPKSRWQGWAVVLYPSAPRPELKHLQDIRESLDRLLKQ